MVEMGQYNTLKINNEVDFGFYLDGGDWGELLLPTRYVPKDMRERDEIEVFLYYDSEDRPIATTETPRVTVGQCAFLKVTSSSPYGAFMDWGLSKDLLVPFKEQRVPMQVGKRYVAYVFLDATGRIAASSKLDCFLEEENRGTFRPQQEVELLIASRTDLGYKAVIEDTHIGLIHNADILQPIEMGTRMRGYIKLIREEDNRIDLKLHATGRDAEDTLCDAILDYLESEGGKSDLTDKSSPEAIYAQFQVSKSSYKKALGKLYKEKHILIDNAAKQIVLL